MTHIAIKINCDGDKCGECEKLTSIRSEDPGGYCTEFDKPTPGGNRIPECIAAELVIDCHTCGRRDVFGQCLDAGIFDECEVGFMHWQPATKGER